MKGKLLMQMDYSSISDEKSKDSLDNLEVAENNTTHSDCHTGCHHHHEPAMPIIKGEKIGRNDPCPCESGKKYKKCCLI